MERAAERGGGVFAFLRVDGAILAGRGIHVTAAQGNRSTLRGEQVVLLWFCCGSVQRSIGSGLRGIRQALSGGEGDEHAVSERSGAFEESVRAGSARLPLFRESGEGGGGLAREAPFVSLPFEVSSRGMSDWREASQSQRYQELGTETRYNIKTSSSYPLLQRATERVCLRPPTPPPTPAPPPQKFQTWSLQQPSSPLRHSERERGPA